MEIGLKDKTKMMNNNKRILAKEAVNTIDCKISTAAAKIIKLRVNDEAINHELKENIKELEEFINSQKSIIHSQLKKIHTLEGDSKNEERMRKDLALKQKNTRAICVTLENYMKDLVTTINMCQNDRIILSDCYKQAVNTINKIKDAHNSAEKKHTQEIEKFQSQLNIEKETKAELVQSSKDVKKALEDVIKYLKEQNNSKAEEIKSYAQDKEQHVNRINSLTNDVSKLTLELNQSEQNVKALNQKLAKQNNDILKLKSDNDVIMVELDKRVKLFEGELNTVKEALSNQEIITENIIKEKMRVEEELGVNMENLRHTSMNFNMLENELRNANQARDEVQQNEIALKEMISLQAKKLENNEESLKTYQDEIHNLSHKINDNLEIIRRCQDEKNNLKMRLEEYSLIMNNKEITWQQEKMELTTNMQKNKESNLKYNNIQKENEEKILILEEQIKELKKHEEENLNKILTLEEELKVKTNAIASIKKQIIYYRDEINNVIKSNDEHIKDKELLKGEIVIVQTYLENKNKKLIELSLNVDNLKGKLEEKNKECQELAKKHECADNQINVKDIANITDVKSSPVVFTNAIRIPIPESKVDKINNKLPSQKPNNRKRKLNSLNPANYNYEGLSDSSYDDGGINVDKVTNFFTNIDVKNQTTSSVNVTSQKTYLKINNDNFAEPNAVFSKPSNVNNVGAKKRSIFSSKPKKSMKN